MGKSGVDAATDNKEYTKEKKHSLRKIQTKISVFLIFSHFIS